MEVSATTFIRRPASVVFDYVVDPSNDANWRTGVDESGLQTEDPVEPGVMGYTRVGDARVEWRIVSYTPGECVEWDLISGPIRGHGGYRAVPVEGGTEFTLIADVVPTVWFRLLGPVFGWVGRRQNQRDVEKLRDILESTPEP